jgi:hypothetical protein
MVSTNSLWRLVATIAPTEHTSAPGNDQEAEPPTSSNPSNDIVGRQFEKAVTNEEDEKGNVVTRTGENEVLGHACDERRADVGSIEEGKSEDDTQHGKHSQVDLPPVIKDCQSVKLLLDVGVI